MRIETKKSINILWIVDVFDLTLDTRSESPADSLERRKRPLCTFTLHNLECHHTGFGSVAHWARGLIDLALPSIIKTGEREADRPESEEH